MMKLFTDPETKEYMKDPEFIKILQSLQTNPAKAMQIAQKDPRVMKAIQVMFGLPSGPGGFEDISPTEDQKKMYED